MKKIIEVHIPGDSDIFKHLVQVLLPHHTEPVGSRLFIVEGSSAKPRVGIRYPGYKLKQRMLKKPNKNSALWANLLDFEVVPFEHGKESSSILFTYAKLLKDFDEHKKHSDTFWKLLEQVYKHNSIEKEPPKLGGIDSRQFLEMLKWMWIQEDLNYRLSWQEVGSEIRYRLQNKNGSPTSKGAGRTKFYAALLLIRCHDFDYTLMRKIIS